MRFFKKGINFWSKSFFALFNIALSAFRHATLGCLFDHQVKILRPPKGDRREIVPERERDSDNRADAVVSCWVKKWNIPEDKGTSKRILTM